MAELTGNRTAPSALCRVFCFVFVTVLPFSIGAADARADKLEFKTIAKSAGPRDLIGIPSTCRLASGDILVVYHQICCHVCFGIHDQPSVDYYKARMPELTPSQQGAVDGNPIVRRGPKLVRTVRRRRRSVHRFRSTSQCSTRWNGLSGVLHPTLVSKAQHDRSAFGSHALPGISSLCRYWNRYFER